MKKKKRTFLTTKITIGFLISIAIMGTIIFFCCQYYNVNSAKLEFRKHAISCAKGASNVLYDTNFDEYLKNGKNEDYREKISVINSICKNFELKYLYVYIPNFDKNELTTIFYVDGSGAKNVKNRDLGTKIPWKFTRQEKEAYKGIENIEMYDINNQMGHTITSYAPVYDKQGRVIALVGADLDFDIVHNKIVLDILKIISFISICLFLIYSVLISYLRIVFIKPVVKISSRMSGFVNRNNNDFAPLEIKSDDELGLMASSFNKMVNDINNYIKKISDTQMETIFSLAKLAQSRDDDTGKHLERVQQYCNLLAHKLKENSAYSDFIDEKFIENLVNASTLHDIGKVGIPDYVLLKKGKLTPEEYNIIKQHTTIGYETLKEVHAKFKSNAFIEMGMSIALYHHERFDGKGYPTGLKGQQIPLEARIMAIADVYDALGTKRVYKPAFSQEKCIEIIKEGRGTQFDPVIVDAFLEIADKFYEIRCSMEDNVEENQTIEQ